MDLDGVAETIRCHRSSFAELAKGHGRLHMRPGNHWPSLFTYEVGETASDI